MQYVIDTTDLDGSKLKHEHSSSTQSEKMQHHVTIHNLKENILIEWNNRIYTVLRFKQLDFSRTQLCKSMT